VPRLRSVAVVALLWVAAFAGSSAPDGFGGSRGAAWPLIAGMPARPAHAAPVAEAPRNGKRWALADPGGKRWSLFDDVDGKRWA
jgi:hypothetical protein